MEKCGEIRKNLIESDLVSTRLLLLAMPALGMVIQCGLFLFGKTCSPFPMWISFLVFSFLAFLIDWKCLAKFCGLIILSWILTAYSFPYFGFDQEVYHIPMQIILRDGWNPVFDSSLEKFNSVTNTSLLRVYHTLFLPKTVALCGALVAKSTGLWIAGSFLGYLLIISCFWTAFVFAEKTWKCKRPICFLFAVAVSLIHPFNGFLEGFIDFFSFSALMISLFSLALYLQYHKLHDLILAIIASAICSTVKWTGLVNCVLLWGGWGLYSWKHKETWWSILAVTLLVAWIGISPLITSWIQYGSPFYPTMTFDPKIATVDLTSDFEANADGERMGYLARFVYAWISPLLATKASAILYHRPDFNPVFSVPPNGVGGFGKGFCLLFCFCIILLLSAKKGVASFIALFILSTLVLCPIKYIGYARYFPQAWAIVPLGIYQFCFFPPEWLVHKNKLKKAVRCCLYLIVFIFSCIFCFWGFIHYISIMTIEGKVQRFLNSFREEGIVFEIPRTSGKGFALGHRLACGKVNCFVSEKKMENFETDTYFLRYKEYYLTRWRFEEEYRLNGNPFRILKLLDIFHYFPRPLFCRRPNDPELSVPATMNPGNQEMIEN